MEQWNMEQPTLVNFGPGAFTPSRPSVAEREGLVHAVCTTQNRTMEMKRSERNGSRGDPP